MLEWLPLALSSFASLAGLSALGLVTWSWSTKRPRHTHGAGDQPAQQGQPPPQMFFPPFDLAALVDTLLVKAVGTQGEVYDRMSRHSLEMMEMLQGQRAARSKGGTNRTKKALRDPATGRLLPGPGCFVCLNPNARNITVAQMDQHLAHGEGQTVARQRESDHPTPTSAAPEPMPRTEPVPRYPLPSLDPQPWVNPPHGAPGHVCDAAPAENHDHAAGDAAECPTCNPTEIPFDPKLPVLN